MAMDGLPEGVPPSGRVPEQLLQAVPILKRRRWRYRGEFAENRSILGVSTPRAKYRQRGHREGPQGSQEGARRGLGWGRARDLSGVPVVAPLPSFGDFGGLQDADFLYTCSGIFGALLMAGKPEIQKEQKTRTGNCVH